jgi:Na+/proline symporter
MKILVILLIGWGVRWVGSQIELTREERAKARRIGRIAGVVIGAPLLAAGLFGIWVVNNTNLQTEGSPAGLLVFVVFGLGGGLAALIGIWLVLVNGWRLWRGSDYDD